MTPRRSEFEDEVGRHREDLPPEPGTSPVPSGHVRLFHYTDPENLPSIRREGLKRSKAHGATYGEPSMVWATAGVPKDIVKPNVEFHADPAYHKELDIGEYYGQGGTLQQHIEHLEQARSNVTMRGDVPPSRILAIHEPWQSHVRYIERDPRTLADYTTGDFKDSNTGDP